MVVEKEVVDVEDIRDQNLPEFDRAVHDAAMAKLAPVHHERMRTAAEARAAVAAYVKTRGDSTPEQLEGDTHWQALKTASSAAESARQEIRLEIASRVRARLRHEAANKRAGHVAVSTGKATSLSPAPEAAVPEVAGPTDRADLSGPPDAPDKIIAN